MGRLDADACPLHHNGWASLLGGHGVRRRQRRSIQTGSPLLSARSRWSRRLSGYDLMNAGGPGRSPLAVQMIMPSVAAA